MIGIYKITNKINNNSYIGLSTHIEDRWKYHRDPYNWNRESNKLLYKAIIKYGIDNFEFEVLEECTSAELSEKEKFYINKYDTWSSYKPEDEGILVAYNSIHGNTKKAVEELEKMLKENGVKKVVVSDLSRNDMSETIANAFRYDKLIIASPTYDTGLFPSTEKFLRNLKHKNYQNRRIGIIENGSWAPMAAKCMNDIIKEMKNIETCNTTVTIKTRMNDESKKKMKELVKELLNK